MQHGRARDIWRSAAGWLVVHAVCLAGAQAGSADVPLGHKDFYPSDARPIGFRGDGSGAYPGATPVAEWRDGDVDWVDMQVENWGDAGGNQRGTYRKGKVPVFRNRNSVNILWKTEMPGFSNSSPIVVGDRVFCMADPYSLVCTDVNTGKILWQADINPFELQNLPREEVARLTQLMEICRAVRLTQGALTGNYGRVPREFVDRPERRAWWLQRFRDLEQTAKRAAELDADKAYGGEQVLARTRAAIAAIEAYKPGQDPPPANVFTSIHVPMAKALSGKGRFNAVVAWTGLVNSDFPTPVSDGKFVYVSLGQGQVACYDLDGKRRWGIHVPLRKGKRMGDVRLGHCPSPVLVGNVLIVQQVHELMGIDKGTGRVLWEEPELRVSGYNMGTFWHARLNGPGGGRDVLCMARGQVVDPADGKVLANMVEDPEYARWDVAPSVLGWGEGMVLWRDQSVSTNVIAALSLAADGKVSIAKRAKLDYGGSFGGGSVIMDPVGGQILAVSEGGGAFCPSTGAMTFAIRCRYGGVGPILAGRLIVGGGHSWGHGGEYRSRPDKLAVQDFPVVDLTNPANIRAIQGHNLLGGLEKPHVRCLEKWAPKDYQPDPARPEDTIWGMYGVPPSASAACPAAQGDRLFLRTMAYLYCIGPAVKGTPADEPRTVAAIRAETDPARLPAYLAHASAQYRCEAVKRLGALKAPLPPAVSQLLARLLIEDAYAEIRAAALTTLDACDPQGKAGWARLAAEMPLAFPADIKLFHGDESAYRRHRLHMTFRALGAAGPALLAARWPAAADPLQVRVLLELATVQGWAVDAITTAALEVIRDPKLQQTPIWRTQVPGNTQNLRLLPAYFAATDAAADPAVAEVLSKAYPTDWALFDTFNRHLPRDKKLAWVGTAAPNNFARKRNFILRTWQRIGPAAVPSMERVAAELSANPEDGARMSYARIVTDTIEGMRTK